MKQTYNFISGGGRFLTAKVTKERLNNICNYLFLIHKLDTVGPQISDLRLSDIVIPTCFLQSACLHRASIVSKHLFIIPTDAHNYTITGMLKTIKIPTFAPTCFGSCRNHHQEAISCLARSTIMILLCLSLMTWSVLCRHISLLCKRAVLGRGRN